jgi:hypothetical protein
MVARQSEMIANVRRLHEHMDRDGCVNFRAMRVRLVTWIART